MIPLTRQPDGMQAWKIIIPTSKAYPEPRAHDGHEWIYVLSGHMRFILGDQDVVLGPGEVAAFDTTTCRTGSAARATNPPRSSASSDDPVNRRPSTRPSEGAPCLVSVVSVRALRGSNS